MRVGSGFQIVRTITVGAVRHAALEPAGAVSQAVEPAPPGSGRSRRAPPSRGGRRPSIARRSPPPGGLDREHPSGDPAVQAAVGRDVRAEPRRHPDARTSAIPAEGVAIALGGLDLGDHRRLRRGVPGSAPGTPRRARSHPAAGLLRRRRPHRSHLQHGRSHLDADGGDQRPGDRPGGDPGGRLAGTRPLEHVAHVLVAVLERPPPGRRGRAGQPDRPRPASRSPPGRPHSTGHGLIGPSQFLWSRFWMKKASGLPSV